MWIALCRYLLPSIQHWVFDQQRLQMAHLERMHEAGWNDLLDTSRHLLCLTTPADAPVIALGQQR